VVSQIPLIHAWALSIHKCQQRWRGPAYSNTSRTRHRLIPVKTLNGLYLSGFDVSRIMTRPSRRSTVVRRQRDRPDPDSEPDQCSEPEPDSELKHGDARAKL
jgi:hypothetical protein